MECVVGTAELRSFTREESLSKSRNLAERFASIFRSEMLAIAIEANRERLPESGND